jgi:thermolysin
MRTEGRDTPRTTERVPISAAASGELRQWDGVVTRMTRAGELRLTQIATDTMMPGRSHERFDQYYRGIRVLGGGIVRQTSANLTVSIFGELYSEIGITPEPSQSEQDASDAVRGIGTVSRTEHPELVVLPLEAGGYALAYRLRVYTGADRVVCLVDAMTGAVIFHYSDFERQSAVGSGTGVLGDPEKISARASGGAFIAEDLLRPADISTYDMRGNVSRTLDALDGVVRLGASDFASSPNNIWTDGPDVSAHVYAGFTYDYYFKRFGRRGLDDHNLPITVLTHPVRRSDISTASDDLIGLFYLNAFYAGDGMVVYGEGLPPGFVLRPFNQTVDFFSAGLDVVAHELSHGVTEFSSGLIYRNESGALNEAFSDFMGVSAKFFFQPVGDGPLQANYDLGSDVFRPGGIRSFSNPQRFGYPDHYSHRYVGADDNGGVHTNCTIIDHAFYLAIEGGTNRTSGLSVKGSAPRTATKSKRRSTVDSRCSSPRTPRSRWRVRRRSRRPVI